MKIIFKSAATTTGIRDVYVQGGKISAPFKDADRVIDSSGKFLMPGMIDSHVHFRTPGANYKEDFESGSRAAVVGGVTTVLDMPNTNPPTINLEALREKRELIRGKSYVNYGFFFGVTKDNFEDMAKVINVPGFKMYMGSSTGGLLLDDSTLWEKAFRIAKAKNLPVVVHAENEKRIEERMNEFKNSTSLNAYSEARDCECAMIATAEAVELRKQIGNKLHIAHLSCGKELDTLRKNADVNLTCEVCPHHLYFSMLDMKDAYLKMNPPLRHEEDLRSLWEGVRDGAVNIIATDHAPHSLEEKMQDQWTAPAGVPGVEFVLPLLLNEINQNMLSPARLVQLVCEEPARIFGIKNKGKLEIGYDADLVLIDMNMEKTISRDMVLSKCGWSPYEGYKLKGWPIITVVGGEIVCENRQILSEKLGRECIFG